MTVMRQACENLPLPQTVEQMLSLSGLLGYYHAEREGADRVENLNELINAAMSFVHEAVDDSLTAFLAHASLEAGDHQTDTGKEALQLMTVHSAKGLEFHSVFLTGLEEGLFPHENSRNETNGQEEERRLMYVAMTRACRRLYLSFSQSRMLHGQTRYNVPSRFLDEIPENLMKWLQSTHKTDVRYFKSSVDNQYKSAASQSLGNTKSRVVGSINAQAMQWHIGQNVAHNKFGPGVIINCEGQGNDARVQVNFDRVGTKWLLLEYAKLTSV